MSKLWFLRRLDLFEGLSEPEMERLGTLLQMRSCRSGQDLVVRPSGDRIYLVKAGRVRVLQGGVAVAPAAQFLGAMAVHPRLAAKLAMILARQLFELEQVVERSATDPVSSRLAELLLRAARRDGPTTEVRGISQADLARMIGSSRESVSRLIAEWERDGIVHNRPRLIELADEAALRRLAS